MTDPLIRALGRAEMQRVAPEADGRRPFDKAYERKPVIPEIDFDCPEIVKISKEFAKQIESQCCDEIASVIEKYYPDKIVCGGDIIKKVNELVAEQDRIKRLRKKFRWIPVTETLPKHERRVLIYTEYGVYRGWYDHKWKCWRTTRTVKKVTHWRNQDDPESWA